MCATSLMLLVISGCATHTATVIDSSSDWVRLDKPTKASVETAKRINGELVWIHAGTVWLPAGMMVGPGVKK